MTKTVYLMATADNPHLTAIAAALVDQLLRQSVKVGLFWPIRPAADQTMTDLLARAGANQPLETAIGASYNQVHQDLDQAMMAMIGKLTDLQASVDLVVCVGSDYSDLIAPMEFSINAKIAANLDAPVLLIITDPAQSPSDLPAQARLYVDALREKYATCMGLIVPSGSADQAHWPKPLSLVEAVDFGHTPLSISPQAASTIVAADLPGVRTPLRFQFELARRARADLRTIILPEAEDDRILKAASEIIDRGLAHLILLGDPAVVAAQAKVLGVDLTGARIQDPTDPKLVERFAEEYTKLRAHKGMTLDRARQTLTDLSYFATMMIHFGMADGMVSGAIHTTANTIRPSLEFIKTKPGVALVSGYFLMCLPDQVLVFADCAVNPNPSAAQLADIAQASADTARSFEIAPRVALLSYSTAGSGSGPDVDLVTEATELLQTKAPDLPVAGPIQFDAAVDQAVAATKLPGSKVAGHATVFVFPDLDSGNITYKAVQRTAHTLALGPVLQGLRKPVNDLSRGALVDDIVNTVAITAIQAQSDPPAQFRAD